MFLSHCLVTDFFHSHTSCRTHMLFCKDGMQLFTFFKRLKGVFEFNGGMTQKVFSSQSKCVVGYVTTCTLASDLQNQDCTLHGMKIASAFTK